jgi:hypothetical protein
MSNMLTQIGTFMSSGAGKAVEGGAVAGTGLVQNLLANSEAQQKQSFVENLIKNPAAFQKFVSGFTQPLTAGLTADVARSSDAYGAERGLGSSPAVMKDIYAQALAPYLVQQQNSGQQAAMQALGIYGSTPTTKPVDVSSILKMIMMGGQQQQGPNPTAGINPAAVPNTFGTLADLPGAAPTPQLPPPMVGGGDGGFDPSTLGG